MNNQPLEKLIDAIDFLTRSSSIFGYVMSARDCAPERFDAGEGWVIADATAGLNTALSLLNSALDDLREDAESAKGDCKDDC